MSDKEMHKATCAECGKEREVPFKPNSSRPMHCRECYAKTTGKIAKTILR